MYTPHGRGGCDLEDRVGSGEPALARLRNRGLSDWHVDPLFNCTNALGNKDLAQWKIISARGKQNSKDSAVAMRAHTVGNASLNGKGSSLETSG
jgi:hypothetical protein